MSKWEVFKASVKKTLEERGRKDKNKNYEQTILIIKIEIGLLE